VNNTASATPPTQSRIADCSGLNPELTANMLLSAVPKMTGNVVRSRMPFLSSGFLSAQISRNVQPNINALAMPSAKLSVVFGV
jgi:hypothetical protein